MTNDNSSGCQDSNAPSSGVTERVSTAFTCRSGCNNSSSSRRGADADADRRQFPHAHGGIRDGSDTATCSSASLGGSSALDGAGLGGASQPERGTAAAWIAEPGHAIAALSLASLSQRRHFGCSQALLSSRSAWSMLVLVLSLALAAGGLHGVAAQQTCPAYIVTPAIQANCTIPTYDPSTCILRTWCLS